jgi:hypothetical protein
MYYYQMILLFAARWMAVAFSVVAGIILILSLCDLAFGANWGAQWYDPLVALGFIAIGLAVRQVALLAWRHTKRRNGS